jgi:hypothetical protein
VAHRAFGSPSSGSGTAVLYIQIERFFLGFAKEKPLTIRKGRQKRGFEPHNKMKRT